MPLPSLHEQRRISNRHSEQARYASLALAAVQRQIEESKRLETGMFLNAFSGELPVRDLRSVTQSKVRNYSKLIDLARLESGHTPSRRRPEVEQAQAADKAGREALGKAQAIEDAVYDLKAVNPREKKITDKRTPAELLAAIEEKGREVDAALAKLRALL